MSPITMTTLHAAGTDQKRRRIKLKKIQEIRHAEWKSGKGNEDISVSGDWAKKWMKDDGIS